MNKLFRLLPLIVVLCAALPLAAQPNDPNGPVVITPIGWIIFAMLSVCGAALVYLVVTWPPLKKLFGAKDG